MRKPTIRFPISTFNKGLLHRTTLCCGPDFSHANGAKGLNGLSGGGLRESVLTCNPTDFELCILTADVSLDCTYTQDAASVEMRTGMAGDRGHGRGVETRAEARTGRASRHSGSLMG